MIIHYWNTLGQKRSIEESDVNKIQPFEHHGKPGIRRMYRSNAANPERLGMFKSEEIRDSELKNIAQAFKEEVEEYTIQNSIYENMKSTDTMFFN